MIWNVNNFPFFSYIICDFLIIIVNKFAVKVFSCCNAQQAIMTIERIMTIKQNLIYLQYLFFFKYITSHIRKKFYLKIEKESII